MKNQNVMLSVEGETFETIMVSSGTVRGIKLGDGVYAVIMGGLQRTNLESWLKEATDDDANEVCSDWQSALSEIDIQVGIREFCVDLQYSYTGTASVYVDAVDSDDAERIALDLFCTNASEYVDRDYLEFDRDSVDVDDVYET